MVMASGAVDTASNIRRNVQQLQQPNYIAGRSGKVHGLPAPTNTDFKKHSSTLTERFTEHCFVTVVTAALMGTQHFAFASKTRKNYFTLDPQPDTTFPAPGALASAANLLGCCSGTKLKKL